MKIWGLALCLLFLTEFTISGQEVSVDPTRVYERSNGILFELKPRLTNPNAKYYYISDNYLSGKIFLNSGETLINLPMRYDIMRNRMEIIIDEEIKVLYASKIDSFSWHNLSGVGLSKFTRCSNYPMADDDMKGFLQILADGPLQLASYTYLKIYPATSSVALSGSHRDHSIFKKEDFFVIRNEQLLDFPKNRKQALELMNDRREEIKQFIRANGLIFSRKSDLVKIMRHYNSLKRS